MRAAKGRGKSAKSLEIINASIRILQEIQPASVRAVCYRLFVEKLIDAMSKNNTGAVGKQLVYAREHGLIPWDWIVDETREAETISSWSNPESIIRAAVNGYRKDYWEMQPRRVEVWSEKGTVRGTVAPILKKYGVTFRVMHGYPGQSMRHQAPPDIGAEPSGALCGGANRRHQKRWMRQRWSALAKSVPSHRPRVLRHTQAVFAVLQSHE